MVKKSHGDQVVICNIVRLTYRGQTQIIISVTSIRGSHVGHTESAGVVALSLPAKVQQVKLPKGCLYQQT